MIVKHQSVIAISIFLAAHFLSCSDSGKNGSGYDLNDLKTQSDSIEPFEQNQEEMNNSNYTITLENYYKDDVMFIYQIDEPAKFPGGMEMLGIYLDKMIEYPKEAIDKGIEGMVLINFVVGSNGKITDVVIKQSAHELLDKEALKVIKNMPLWIPAKNNDHPVKSKYTLPITFKIEDKFELFKGVKELIRRIF